MAAGFEIEGRAVGDDAPALVIAEIGHNHQGDLKQALKMIEVAAEFKVDVVKFQKRDNRSLYMRAQYDQIYTSENAFAETYGAHREVLEFGRDEYVEMKALADALGVIFSATAFDERSADFLAGVDVPLYKIASGDLTNIPLLRHVAAIGKPMVISTGGGTLEDVDRAYEAVRPINENICLMQCTAGYPPAFEELNLRVIETYRNRYPEAVVGLSSHDSGIAMALVGYTLGACVIEKHFTLNRAMKGTDHAFSLEPQGMRKLVRDLRRAEIAMGDGVKIRYRSEEAPLLKMSKQLVAARDLEAGHVLVEGDVAARSPGGGFPPYHLDRLLGLRLVRPMAIDEGFDWSVVSPP